MNRSYLALAACSVIFAGSYYIGVHRKKDTHKVFSCTARTVDFDESMQTNAYQNVLQQGQSQQLLSVFRNLYTRNNFSHVTVQQTAKIPKYLHTVWFGGKMPEEYEPFCQSWIDYHPEWVHIFWTDNKLNYDRGEKVLYSFAELEEFLRTNKKAGARIVMDVSKVDFPNRAFYDKSINFGERSDIIKWEIVYRFGGVYVDTDFQCLQSLDLLNHTYDFYTGLQPLDTNRVQLGAALFAAIPHHPILQQCVEGIKENQHIVPIVAKTGPLHFTRSFIMKAGQQGMLDIAFPASYFYPCSYEQRNEKAEVWQKPEAFAIHHWAGSWLKPEGFVRS